MAGLGGVKLGDGAQPLLSPPALTPPLPPPPSPYLHQALGSLPALEDLALLDIKPPFEPPGGNGEGIGRSSSGGRGGWDGNGAADGGLGAQAAGSKVPEGEQRPANVCGPFPMLTCLSLHSSCWQMPHGLMEHITALQPQLCRLSISMPAGTTIR